MGREDSTIPPYSDKLRARPRYTLKGLQGARGSRSPGKAIRGREDSTIQPYSDKQRTRSRYTIKGLRGTRSWIGPDDAIMGREDSTVLPHSDKQRARPRYTVRVLREARGVSVPRSPKGVRVALRGTPFNIDTKTASPNKRKDQEDQDKRNASAFGLCRH